MRQDKRRGLRLAWRALAQAARLVRVYPALRAEYRARYADTTSETTWRRLLGMERG